MKRLRYIALLVLFLCAQSVFALENSEIWNPYLQKIEKDVKQSWYNASGFVRHNNECKINLFFNVKNTGEILNIKVLNSDCSVDMNNLAIKSLKDCGPFAPFPKQVYNVEEISIDFIFDYRLLPENKRLDKGTENVIMSLGKDNSTSNNLGIDKQTVTVDKKEVKDDTFLRYITAAIILLLTFLSLVFKSLRKK